MNIIRVHFLLYTGMIVISYQHSSHQVCFWSTVSLATLSSRLQTMLLCSWSGVRWSLQDSYLSRRRPPSRDPYPEQGRGPVPVHNICFLDRSAHLVTFNSCLFIALNSTFNFSLQIVAFGTPASTDTNLPETRYLL